MLTDEKKAEFIRIFMHLRADIAMIAYEHGFWENWNDAEKLALIHSEVSEVLELFREPKKSGPHFASELGEELADIIIRVLDFAAHHNIDVGHAMLTKIEKNRNRPYKHNKAF